MCVCYLWSKYMYTGTLRKKIQLNVQESRRVLIIVPINKDDFLDELNTIKYIALANGYNSSLVDNLLKKHKNTRLKPQLGKDVKRTFVKTAYTDIMPKM